MRCTRCLSKGHNCYTDRRDANEQPICIWCEDGEPCIWDQRNKNSQSKSKESPMQQVSVSKTNGHGPVVVSEKRCAGFERECTEMLGQLNRTGLCSACYARKKYAEKYSAAARGKTTPKKLAKPARRAAKDVVEILDAPPPHLDSPRVTLAVTEPQLNQFLVRLSLAEKQRLANYFLQTAES
ncbi:MAG: hypothetical protein JWO19_4389 [Bryobacterales bacterium]|nr:hypothetical protein [Bryobacterales bacterium]